MTLTRTQNEGLCPAPVWTPHRRSRTGDDAAIGHADIKRRHTMDTKGWTEVVADVYFSTLGGATSVVAEVVYWSDQADKTVKSDPAQQFTLTTNKQFRFRADGRRVFIHISGTWDGAVAHVALAGVNEPTDDND